MYLMFVLGIFFLNCVHSAQYQDDASLHVRFNGEDITVNESSSTWAVGTENLTVAHVFKANLTLDTDFAYFFILPNSSRSDTICQYMVVETNCTLYYGNGCDGCIVTVHGTKKTVTMNLLLPVLDATKNQWTLVYDMNIRNVYEVPLHNFTISECPRSVGQAQAENLPDPCGYGCTSQFSCPNGYYSEVENSSLYRCTPRSEWSPVPVCLPETSTTVISTTFSNQSSSSSNNTPETDPTRFASQSSRLTSASLIAAIGIILMISYTVIALYGWKNKFVLDNVATLFVAKGVCVVSWLIAVGLLFGLPGDNSAYVAGTIVGILSLVGMVAILLLHIWKIKTKKNQKGIPGKDVKL